MNDALDFILDAKPPMLLAIGLTVLALGIKKSPLPDWLIPILMLVAGAVAYPFIAETGKVSFQVRSPALFNALIGLCIGGASQALQDKICGWIFKPPASPQPKENP